MSVSSEWKWEVNHDGVIFSYQGRPLCRQEEKEGKEKEGKGKDGARPLRSSLVDYWYLVHDGVVIPSMVNDP